VRGARQEARIAEIVGAESVRADGERVDGVGVRVLPCALSAKKIAGDGVVVVGDVDVTGGDAEAGMTGRRRRAGRRCCRRVAGKGMVLKIHRSSAKKEMVVLLGSGRTKTVSELESLWAKIGSPP